MVTDQGSISSTEKKNENHQNVKFHWDLNLPMDAWDQPDNVEDEISGRDVEEEITVDETAAGKGKEYQSGYGSEFEGGELRESYPWADYEAEVKHVDYGSEPKDEKFLSVVVRNDNKMEASNNGSLPEMKFRHVKCESGDALKIRETNEESDSEKHVVVYMSDSYPKGSSSSSRSFGSKPFKVPSHDAIHRRRHDNFKELSSGPAGRDNRSGMRMRIKSPEREYYSSWDSKRRFSPRTPPNYKRGSFGFERARPKSMVDGRGMMNGYDQSRPGHGARPHGRSSAGPDGHVRRQFSDDGYRGLLGKYPDGWDRDFRGSHGDTNQMSATRRERGNYQQSESRSRSYSPVSWNGQSRSSPAPPSGSRAEERMRLPFKKQFLADQEMRFMPPPRNRTSTSRFFEEKNNDAGENHNNNFKERKSRHGQRFDVGNSNDNNSSDLRPFIRNRRFEDAEENTGMNRFMIAQRLRTQRSEAMKDGGDDIRRFKFNREQPVVLAADSNKNKSSKSKEP